MENKELILRNSESFLKFLTQSEDTDYPAPLRLYCTAHHTNKGQVELSFHADKSLAEIASQQGEMLVGMNIIKEYRDYTLDVTLTRRIYSTQAQ